MLRCGRFLFSSQNNAQPEQRNEECVKMLRSKFPLRSKEFGVTLVLLAFALALSSPAFAQTTVSNGSISGTVSDASGAVVPGAKVTISGPTGQTITVTTGAQGGYATGSLVPGAY